MHDDFIDHPISVSPEGWQILKQVVTFLGTDLELPPVARRKRLPPFWPFCDESEWLANEQTGSDRRIPEYDPGMHGRWVQPWWNRIPTGVGLAVILGVLAVFVLIMALARAGQ